MTTERRLCLVAWAVVTALGTPRPATASGAARPTIVRGRTRNTADPSAARARLPHSVKEAS